MWQLSQNLTGRDSRSDAEVRSRMSRVEGFAGIVDATLTFGPPSEPLDASVTIPKGA
jgi:hypothetical protein